MGCNSNGPAQTNTQNTSGTLVSTSVPESETQASSNDNDDFAPVEQRGNLTISGVFLKNNVTQGRKVYLFETEGRSVVPYDTGVVSNGKFSMDLHKAPVGEYRLGFSDNARGQLRLIINPLSEEELLINFSGSNLIHGVQFPHSVENQLFQQYLQLENKYNKELKRVRSQKMDTQLKRKEIYSIQSDLKTQQNLLADNNKKLFASKVIRHQQSPERFDRAKYWADINFKDPSLIRSSVLVNRIEDYMRIHGATKKGGDKYSGFYKAVDEMAAIVPLTSPLVREFVFYTMSEGFYSSNMIELSSYVVDNYLYGEDCGDEDVHYLFSEKSSGLKKLMVGNTPPDFTSVSFEGEEINLTDFCAAHKLTLILFWSSSCHKCEVEVPILKKCYNANKNKGYDIIAVSVDTRKDAWIKGISKKTADWTNVSNLKGWRGPIAQSYRVSSTPVMYLLDSQRKLLLRTNKATELNKFVNTHL